MTSTVIDHPGYAGLDFVARSYARTNGTSGSLIAPTGWSENAVRIFADKYLRRAGVPSATEPVPEAGIPDAFRRSIPAPEATFGAETDVRQVFHRLAGAWTYHGIKGGYLNDPEAFYGEVLSALAHQKGAPNSPQWFNTGLNWAYGITGEAEGYFYVDETGTVVPSVDRYSRLSPMACFIVSVDDTLVEAGGIFDYVMTEARIFKRGSGSGANLSFLRGKGERLSDGGTSSGAMSFIGVANAGAGAIKSGGTTRRAAKMTVFDDDHPELLDFIDWKPREEHKAAALVAGSIAIEKHVNAILAAASADDLPSDGRLDPNRNTRLGEAVRAAAGMGIPSGTISQALDLAAQGFTHADLDIYDTNWTGEAFATVGGQNTNISIGLSNAFMRAREAGGSWTLRGRTDQSVNREVNAHDDIWMRLCRAAWTCADPGVLYSTTINAWHTHPAEGRINASNPCVTGDTLVSTTEGAKMIRDLVGKAAFLYGSDNQAHFVSKIFPTGRKPVYRLKTRSGYSVNVTAEHRILTKNRGDVEAKDLNQDDVLVLGKVAAGSSSLDDRIAKTIGLALGDGCVFPTAFENRQLVLTMSHDERAILEPLAAYFSAVKEEDSNANRVRPVSVSERVSTVALSLAYRPIVTEVERFAILDKGSEQKAFRQDVFSLDQESLRHILRGLFTADGTVGFTPNKNAYICLDSCSLTLIEQVQRLLLAFGIKSKIYLDRKPGRTSALLPDGKGAQKNYPVKPLHSLRISRSSRIVFEKKIGFDPSSPKADALSRLNSTVTSYSDRMTDAFMSLTYIGEEDVYDLTEPDTSHFVANGLVIHNCGEYLAADNTACNLAAINLLKFLRDDGTFDLEQYGKHVAMWTTILEISVFAAQLPTATIARKTFEIRNLGLNMCNVGALLMHLGMPYDSDEARAFVAAITSYETALAYRTSAELADRVGPCVAYARNADAMKRVLRNHARAAGLTNLGPFEHLDYEPFMPPRTLYSSPIAEAACAVWADVIERPHFRNLQVSLNAPTGTISFVLDADTTGIEPDYALLKSKQLAGGGNLQIINESVSPALRRMGYSNEQIADITRYIRGTRTFADGGPLSRELLERALSPATIARSEAELGGAYDLNKVIGDALSESERDLFTSSEKTSVLEWIGLSSNMIRKATDQILGSGTIEGAPHLKTEHLPVFDCAVPSGRGERSITAAGHLKMVAAIQPLISGASSKTINLPHTATIADISDTYLAAWKLGIKGITVYRDFSKLSQPLTSFVFDGDMPTTAEAAAAPLTVAERIVYRYIAKQRKLPTRRNGQTIKLQIGTQKFYLRTGEYENGDIGELFVDGSKEGSAFRALLNNFAIAVSMGLQHGVPLEEYVAAFCFTTFEPNGIVIGHDRIKMCRSLLDLIFRELAITYLGRHDLAHVPLSESTDHQPQMPEFVSEAIGDGTYGARSSRNGHANASTNGHAHKPAGETHRNGSANGSASTLTIRTVEHTGNACSNCGDFALVRTGVCETCSSCGTSQSGCS
jgi:ribonucleoside-diphosphate reductase alpha chain